MTHCSVEDVDYMSLKHKCVCIIEAEDKVSGHSRYNWTLTYETPLEDIRATVYRFGQKGWIYQSFIVEKDRFSKRLLFSEPRQLRAWAPIDEKEIMDGQGGSGL